MMNWVLSRLAEFRIEMKNGFGIVFLTFVRMQNKNLSKLGRDIFIRCRPFCVEPRQKMKSKLHLFYVRRLVMTNKINVFKVT